MRSLIRRALLSALLLIPVAHAAQPVADYQFQNTLSSTVAGAPDLTHLIDATKQEPNAFTTTSVDGVSRTVLSFPQFNGVALAPTNDLVSPGVYTVVMLFSFEEVSGYRRILDFKNGSSDNGLYNYSGALYFYPVTSSSKVPITANVFYQVVITRDADNMVRGYVNGSYVFSFNDAASQHGVIDGASRLRFFQDNTGGSAPVREASAGKVARIRIYNVALTEAEVAALDRLPGATSGYVRLMRIVAGLEASAASDVAAWDADGDDILTIVDAMAQIRR